MKRIHKLILLAAIAASPPIAARAQSMTPITASTVGTGNGPTTGTVCLHAVSQTKAPISVTVAGGGMYTSEQPFCQTLTAGALAGALNVPNPLTDSAPGHGYDIVVYDSANGKFTDLGVTYAIGGSTWSLDSFIPSFTAPTTQAFTFTYGSGVAPTSCIAPALDIRINSGGVTESVCSGGVFITVTSSTGSGVTPLVVGASDVIARTSSQSAVSLVASVPSTGKYRISYYLNEDALCASGFMTAGLTFSWFDPVANRTAQSLGLTVGVTQSSSSGSIQGVVPIFAQGSTAITYTSTVTGSCTTGGPASYDVHIAVEAL